MLSINFNKIKCHALAYILICCLTACGGASEEGDLIPGTDSVSNTVTNDSNSSQQDSSSNTSASDSNSTSTSGSNSTSASDSNSTSASDSNSTSASDSNSTSGADSTYSAIVEWDIPTTRENGDDLLLSEIGGYEILYKIASNDQYTTLVVTDQNQSSQNLTNLVAGRYEVRVAVFDTDGIYSEYSSPTYADVGI